MDVMPDELAVRQMFDDLTATQPHAPLDRHNRIRRGARRHRLAQAAGTLTVVAAAAVVAVSIGTGTQRVAPAEHNRSVPGWALPWPDHRNGSVPPRVLDGAVAAWRHLVAPERSIPLSATSKAKVIWYLGQTVVEGQVVVVMFEADGGGTKQLVAGWASASDVMHGQPGWSSGSSPWVLYDVTAPRPQPGLFVGLNVHGSSARTDRYPDNWIVVAAAPSVTDIGWTVSGATTTRSTNQGASISSSGRGGITQADRGLAIADIGQITERVKVTQLDVQNRNLLPHARYVGVPGNADSQVPQLAIVGGIPATSGFKVDSEWAGQGMSGAGLSGDRGHLAIRARCYGPGNLRLTFGTGQHETTLGTIRCDNAVHELITQVRLRPADPRAGLFVYASGLTAYRVVAGTVR